MNIFTPLQQRSVALGVDLGQSQDPTSIAVVERLRYIVPGYLVDELRQSEHGRARLADMRRELPRDHYTLRALEQAPLGESYPAQAQRIKRVIARPNVAEHDPPVFLDYTGVGRAVYDIMRTERVPNLRPITITFQGSGTNAAGGQSVPKLELVGALQALMHTGCLSMPGTLPLAGTIRRELQAFRVSYTAVGNATFGAREGAHDDLVLAVALAVYGLKNERTASVHPLRL